MRSQRVIKAKLEQLRKGPKSRARGNAALAELSGIEKALQWVLGEEPLLDHQATHGRRIPAEKRT